MTAIRRAYRPRISAEDAAACCALAQPGVDAFLDGLVDDAEILIPKPPMADVDRERVRVRVRVRENARKLALGIKNEKPAWEPATEIAQAYADDAVEIEESEYALLD